MQRIRNLILISGASLLAAVAVSDARASNDGATDDGSANVRPAQHPSARAASNEQPRAAAEQQRQSASEAAREAGLDAYDAEQIKQLQRELAARGAYQGRVDGVAGPMTAAALRNFQIQQKIDTSGGLNEATRDALGLNWERRNVSGTDEAGTTAPAPAAQPSTTVRRAEPLVTPNPTTLELRALEGAQARRVQQHLRDLGYYNGSVDGVLGEQSRSALQRFFQDQAALAARGMVSGATLGWLGQEVPADSR